jgi:hypothetical protein
VKLSVILAPLIAAGVAGEVILATVKAFEDQQIDALERRRQSDRDRQTKHRNNVMSRDVTVTVPLRVRVEDSSSKEDIKKEEKKEGAAKPRGLADFISELPSALGSDRIDALVAVRRKKGATFSAHAGKLLATALRACPSVTEAADEMILRNWTGIKPDWLESRRSGAPPNRKPTVVDAMNEIFRERGWTDEPEQLPGNHGDGELVSPGFGGGTKGTVVDLREGAWRRTGSGD